MNRVQSGREGNSWHFARKKSYIQSSFLEQEPIKYHKTYLGRKKGWGLIPIHKGHPINTDGNGAYNILIKAIPKAFVDGIESLWFHPERCQSTF
ncbi:MAG: hypothetical protein ACE5R6_05575 [Candidatus Heimdallarchaeota archaeon]